MGLGPPYNAATPAQDHAKTVGDDVDSRLELLDGEEKGAAGPVCDRRDYFEGACREADIGMEMGGSAGNSGVAVTDHSCGFPRHSACQEL